MRTPSIRRSGHGEPRASRRGYREHLPPPALRERMLEARAPGARLETLREALLRHRSRRIRTEPERSPAALAVSSGYADQPHLTREFGRLAGITPAVYRAGA